MVTVGVWMVSGDVCGCLDGVWRCLWVSGWCLMVSVGVWIVSDGICGCLDGVWWCLWVSGWRLIVSVSVWMVSDGVCGCLDGVWWCLWVSGLFKFDDILSKGSLWVNYKQYQTSFHKNSSKCLFKDPLVELTSECLWLSDFYDTCYVSLLGTCLTTVFYETLRKNDFLDLKKTKTSHMVHKNWILRPLG